MEKGEIPRHLPETVSLLDRLRMAIYHGELTPGQRLVETELAARYDTSRGAVREALVLLSNEGLVSRERNRGAMVRPVSLRRRSRSLRSARCWRGCAQPRRPPPRPRRIIVS